VIAKTGMAKTYVAIVGLFALGAVFASLGTWQLRRAETSRATLAQFASGTAETTLPALPDTLEDDRRFRRVEVEGEYVEQPQFLLDNMLHDGVAGYHVLTALRLPGRREHLLVNRGWVAAGGDRSVLPDVGVGTERRTIAGRLERLPRPGLRLGADGQSGDAVSRAVVLQYPPATALAQRLGEPVLDYQLLLDPGAADGYVREWRAPGVAPERHLGYAGQWWALGLGAVAAAIVMAFRTARRKP
jgi:surfeit locus 1 family protein